MGATGSCCSCDVAKPDRADELTRPQPGRPGASVDKNASPKPAAVESLAFELEGLAADVDADAPATLLLHKSFQNNSREDLMVDGGAKVLRQEEESQEALELEAEWETTGSRQIPDDREEKHHGSDYDALRRLVDQLGASGGPSAPTVSEAHGVKLGQCLSKCPEATEFNVEHLRFAPESFAAMCQQLSTGALPKLPGMTMRRFESSIGEIGARAIAEAATRGAFRGLEELILTNNGLGDSGASAFAEGCTQLAFPALRKLGFAENHIGDEGVSKIADAIRLNDFPKLHGLDLSENQIGDAGAKALARGTAHRDVHTLMLNGNEIRNGGAFALARANMGTAHLHDLGIERNKIGHAGKMALSKLSVILNVKV